MTAPILGFDNLLEWLQELRQTVYLHVLVHYKGYNSETVKRKRCTGRGMGKGLDRPCPLWRTTLPVPRCVPQLGSSTNPTVQVSVELNLQHPIPFLEVGGRDPSRDQPHPGYPGAHPKSLHWHQLRCDQRAVLMSKKRQFYHLGNPKSFSSFVPIGDKDQIYFSPHHTRHEEIIAIHFTENS